MIAATSQTRRVGVAPHRMTRCVTREGAMYRLLACVHAFQQRFARRDEGQDLLEYALLVALIALVAIGAVTAAGTSVSAVFSDIASKIPS